MKLVFITCPQCGKRFYSEMLLVENKLPMHCPGCDIYLPHTLYSEQLGPSASSTLARIRKPLNERTIPEILYIPKRGEPSEGGRS